jgi:hypothetical protein
MRQVITLLNERNQFLEKFYALNEDEIERMTQGNFDNIDGFYQSRENLLNLIQHIERLIENHLRIEHSEVERDKELKRQAEDALLLRNELVTEILDQDLEIISMIEGAKSKIIRELQVITKGRRVVGSYHSGEKNHALDEEV